MDYGRGVFIFYFVLGFWQEGNYGKIVEKKREKICIVKKNLARFEHTILRLLGRRVIHSTRKWSHKGLLLIFIVSRQGSYI
jgi:hypothetical protein